MSRTREECVCRPQHLNGRFEGLKNDNRAVTFVAAASLPNGMSLVEWRPTRASAVLCQNRSHVIPNFSICNGRTLERLRRSDVIYSIARSGRRYTVQC